MRRVSSSRSLAALLLYVALSVVWTWPLGAQLASRIAHDAGDPVLNTYLIGWNAATLPFGPGWWDPPFFFPMRGALALSEHLAGLAIFTTPIQLLGGNAVLAYNFSLLASFALSAWLAYLLVHRLTGCWSAAICAGLAYGFAPVRAGQLPHLQMLTSQWLPLLLLGMHAYLEEGRRRWLVLMGAAWLLNGLSNGYYLIFTPVLVALWLAWFPRWRRDPRRALTLAAAWAMSSLPFVPLLLKYREVHTALGLTRGATEIQKYSGSLASFLNPPPMLAVWPPRDVLANEAFLFPGVTVILVVTAAAIACVARGTIRTAARRRSPLLFYAVAAVLMAALTLGPGGEGDGASRLIRPYFWLTLLPGFDAVRVPVRFAMLSALCAAVAAGLGLASLLPSRRSLRAVAASAVAAGLFVDGFMDPMPLVPPPGRQLFENVPANAAVLEVPADDVAVSVNAMYRALFHGRPLVNGYSGYIPPHYDILGQSLRRGDPSGVMELTRGRPLVILINDRFDPARDFRDLVESLPGVTHLGTGSGGAMYLLPAAPRQRVDVTGTPVAAIATRHPRKHVVFDLGATRTVRTIEFPLRRNYPELGERIAVEASIDAETWSMVWLDWTAGRAIAAALEDPRVLPVRILLPDIRARYLRIHPVPEWMENELKILEP
jgi:hypothetical protein